MPDKPRGGDELGLARNIDYAQGSLNTITKIDITACALPAKKASPYTLTIPPTGEQVTSDRTCHLHRTRIACYKC